MTDKININKNLIETTKDKLSSKKNNFLDQKRFESHINTFIITMTSRIDFCEKLQIEIEKGEYTKEDTVRAKEKIEEVLLENESLQEKWLDFFDKEKNILNVKE